MAHDRVLDCQVSVDVLSNNFIMPSGLSVGAWEARVLPASISVYRRSLSSQGDQCGRSWTVILNPEKRKVGGSTQP